MRHLQGITMLHLISFARSLLKSMGGSDLGGILIREAVWARESIRRRMFDHAVQRAALLLTCILIIDDPPLCGGNTSPLMWGKYFR